MDETNLIHILIVDDHALLRSGLKNFIYSYEWMELVGEAGNGEDAIAFCTRNDVDVVLMDLMMPGMGGSEATQRILALGKPVRIIILTSFHEQEQVEQAMKAGATSYLLKNVSADELANAIRAAYAGHATLAPEATEALIQATRHRQAVGHDLTEREKVVLTLLVNGKSNREISSKLSISSATVKYHLGNIYSKLGVKNRIEAVTVAMEHRLVAKQP